MKFFASEDNVKVTGRTLFADNVRYLSWSGSSVSFRFRGKRAVACLSSDGENWEENLQARIGVCVSVSGTDAAETAETRNSSLVKLLPDLIGHKRICLSSRTETQEEGRSGLYTLYESDTVQTVTITIQKYSEAPFAYCAIRWLSIDSDELLPPPGHAGLRLEIIGDSITCGYGVEAANELEPFSTATENPAKSYSLLLARALNAEVNLVSWSGNGIISHYVDENALEPRAENLIPQIYPYTDIATSQKLFGPDRSKWERWDFTRFVPDHVLINVGTNDCSWCRDIPERKEDFSRKYYAFLENVRKCNPNAFITCMLGTMDTRLIREEENAVREFSLAHRDERIRFISLPPQNPGDGYGADWHPSAKTQLYTAEFLLPFFAPDSEFHA